MPVPHEIIAAPFTIYLAPVGTAMPAINAAPGGAFFKMGTSGDKNYTEDGVTVSHPQAQTLFRGAGATAPRKAFRTEEDLLVAFALADLGPEQYAKTLNNAAVTTVGGPPGHKSFALWRGLQVSQFALLARGMSTVDNVLNAQYEVATCIEDAEQAPVFTKGNPAVLNVQLRGLDASGDGTGFGVFRIQTSA